MLTINTQFESELKKRIAEELARLRAYLESPSLITDFAQYRWYAGQIDSLKRVINDYCDEVNTELNKR